MIGVVTLCCCHFGFSLRCQGKVIRSECLHSQWICQWFNVLEKVMDQSFLYSQWITSMVNGFESVSVWSSLVNIQCFLLFFFFKGYVVGRLWNLSSYTIRCRVNKAQSRCDVNVFCSTITVRVNFNLLLFCGTIRCVSLLSQHNTVRVTSISLPLFSCTIWCSSMSGFSCSSAQSRCCVGVLSPVWESFLVRFSAVWFQ